MLLADLVRVDADAGLRIAGVRARLISPDFPRLDRANSVGLLGPLQRSPTGSKTRVCLGLSLRRRSARSGRSRFHPLPPLWDRNRTFVGMESTYSSRAIAAIGVTWKTVADQRIDNGSQLHEFRILLSPESPESGILPRESAGDPCPYRAAARGTFPSCKTDAGMLRGRLPAHEAA